MSTKWHFLMYWKIYLVDIKSVDLSNDHLRALSEIETLANLRGPEPLDLWRIVTWTSEVGNDKLLLVVHLFIGSANIWRPFQKARPLKRKYFLSKTV